MRILPSLLSLLVLASRVAAADPVADAFGGEKNVTVARAAARVDACILRYIPPVPRPDGSMNGREEHYEETVFVALDARTTTQVRELLLSPKTYVEVDHTGSRRPQYYVRLRFREGETTLTADFCFRCKVLTVERDGTVVGGANFGGNADLILNLFARVFPGDAALQSLAREH